MSGAAAAPQGKRQKKWLEMRQARGGAGLIN
jgi:hypothetical protein